MFNIQVRTRKIWNQTADIVSVCCGKHLWAMFNKISSNPLAFLFGSNHAGESKNSA